MKTTVYLNEAAEERLKKIKAINPSYTVSEAADAGLKLEEAKVDAQLTGITEQIAFRGSSIMGEFIGTKAKFFGRELATVRTSQTGPDTYEYQKLYITKKNQYLIQFDEHDEHYYEQKLDYEICPTVKELQQKASPTLLTSAGRTKGEFLEDLDI